MRPTASSKKIDAGSACGFAFGYPSGRFSYILPADGYALWDNRRCSGGLRLLFAIPGGQRRRMCQGERGRAPPFYEGSPMKPIRLVSTPTRNRRLNEIIGMIVLVAAALLLLALAS